VAYTQSDVDRLKTAIAQGVRRVRFNDRDIEFRSLDEMERSLALMERELAASPKHYRVAAFTKGLDE
jgi:hypothetical protein